MSKRRLYGWVVRGKTGLLVMFKIYKPYKTKMPNLRNNIRWVSDCPYGTKEYLPIDDPIGDGVTWKDEPRPVYLTRRNPDDVQALKALEPEVE